MLFFVSLSRPASAYPTMIASFWTANSLGGVQAYAINGTQVLSRLNVRGAGWSVAGKSALSVTTTVDSSLNLHSVLIAMVIYNDPFSPNDPAIAIVSASENADGSFSLGMDVFDDDDNGALLYSSQGEQPVTAGSVWLGL